MKKREIIRKALIDASLTALYIILIGAFMYFMSQSSLGDNPSVLIPIFMLMLFVFSAALTGWLVFGKPIMWYLDGKKKEAIHLLGYTLAIFLIITLIALVVLVGIGI